MPSKKFQVSTVDIVIGTNVRNFRIRKCLDVKEVSDTIGINVPDLLACEAGSKRFEPIQLYRLSRMLDVNISDFFYYIDPAPIKRPRTQLSVVYTAS